MDKAWIILGAIVLVVAASASYAIQTHTEERTIHVVSKERLLQVSTDKDGASSSSYKNFVYSNDEAYVVQDSLWNGQFRSGTVYALIQPNADCRVKLAGYRIGFFSMYQNIISAQCSAGPTKGA